MRVLIVEDDPRIAGLLDQGMREEGFQTLVVSDGVSGLDAAMNGEFEVVVLDLMLPRLDGFEVARQLRKAGNNTPVIMLTARESDADIVRGLNLGADDYVTKPFSFDVLLARVRAVLRRGPVSAPIVATIADLEVDIEAHTATRAGRLLSLTPREFRLLELLVRNSPRVVPRHTIMEEIWGYDSDVSENNLEAFVSQLRSKVDAGNQRRLIWTVRGTGYCVRVETE
jgi:two-component system copper resistance phosphate regulon response regulator CusR